MVGDQHKYNQRPTQLCHQVCCRTPNTQYTDQVGNNAGNKNRADQGNIAVKTLAHITSDELYQGGNRHFRHSLLTGDPSDFQTGTQPDAKGGDDGHNQKADHHGLGDIDFAQQGYIFNCI